MQEERENEDVKSDNKGYQDGEKIQEEKKAKKSVRKRTAKKTDISSESVSEKSEKDSFSAPVTTVENKKENADTSPPETETGIEEKNETDSAPKADAVNRDISDNATLVTEQAPETNDMPKEEKATEPTASDLAEETKFIIPEAVTFFVTETDEAEDEHTPLPENTITTNENGLLNVEHFSDYKSKESESSEQPVSEAEEVYEEFHTEAYEDLTILEDEEPEEEVSTPPKQKYEDPDRERFNPKKPRKVDGRFDFLELFIFTLLAVVLLTTFVFRHSVVEGHSMQNTLQDGEHLIISNLFYTPKKGDIVVCHDKASGHQAPIVKRIIATEGDTIEIRINKDAPQDKKERFTVLVNDEPLTEDYVFVDGLVLANGWEEYPGLEKTTVPDGMLFVMGDHRNNSSDSRDIRDGSPNFIREDSVLGKVILRFYPFSEFGTVD